MTDAEIARQAIVLITVHVGLSGVLGYVLYKWITRHKPSTYARRWLGWMVGVATLANFPRVIREPDVNSVGQWILPMAVIGTLVWVAGWLYGKMKGTQQE